MKIQIKKILLPLLFSIIIGSISGSIVYCVYHEKVNNELTKNKVYLLEYGDYDNIDNLNMDKYSSKYIYFLDENNYKKVLGITKNKDNIKKIKSIYDEELLTNTYYLDNEVINNKIKNYDRMLKDATNKDDIEKIVDLTLELYNNNEDNTLVKR